MTAIRWDNAPSLEIVQRPTAASRRPFLVFVVPDPGRECPLARLGAAARDFDIAARFYGPPGRNDALAREADYVMTGGLSKFHAAALFLAECDLVDRYQGYMFLDGDLEFEAGDLNQFLSLVHAAELDLAQPSLTRDSYCYWEVAYHQPGFLFRQTSFIEVMAPYISKRALPRVIETFSRSISTYGLDLVWPSLIDSEAIGIVDAFQIRHRDKVDHVSGKFYKYLKSIGVDLDEEEREILAHYGVTPQTPHSRRGYFRRRAVLFSSQPGTLMSVALDGPEMTTNNRLLIRLRMQMAKLKSTRIESQLDRKIGSRPGLK